MSWFLDRAKEPSSAAGIGLIVNGLPGLIASGGVDPMAWASVITGLIAVVKKEAPKPVQ